MPLIRVELFEGRTPEQKREFAQALTETTMKVLNCKAEAVEVMFFDVARHDWVTGGVPWSERSPAPPPAKP
jgi:4-oxalocrotonate tautomerase